MELEIGTDILYTSAAGTRKARIKNIRIAPTARPGFLNTWLVLDIPVQAGVTHATSIQIPGDDASLKGFQVVRQDSCLTLPESV